jgi:hypothetical protein
MIIEKKSKGDKQEAGNITKAERNTVESFHWDKDTIQSLRTKHTCSNVTISYSNTGGLMIMGVSTLTSVSRLTISNQIIREHRFCFLTGTWI